MKVDLVPCGPIEVPPGKLVLRASTRVLNTVGLAEAFGSASALDVGDYTIGVPTPSAFVLFKLLSFLDRREPRDLADLGYVVRHAPVDPARVWSDDAVQQGLASGWLTYEDMGTWQLGRGVWRQFSATTVAVFVDALGALAKESDAVRTQLVDGFEPDERTAAADRIIRILTVSASG